MRRRLSTLTVVPLLLLGVAACGEDPADDTGFATSSPTVDMGEAIEGIEVSGEVGEEPEVTIDGPLELDGTASQVITAGEGAEVVEGNKALLHLYVANGRTGERAAATFDQGSPAPVDVAEGQIFTSVLDAIVGKPSGSRVLVASTPAEAYGDQGMEQLSLKPEDPVVFVVDIMSAEPTEVLDGPEGEPADVPADLPTVVEEGGDVTELTFDEAPSKPADELQVIPLVEGDGPPVREGSLVTFDYLGQIYGTDKIFDESFSKEPVTFPVGIGGLIKAWDEGLVGVNRGSRVMLVVPPDFGYGSQGNPSGGIGGEDTLVFVVDILGVD